MSEGNSEPHVNHCNSLESNDNCFGLTPAINQAPHSSSLNPLPAGCGRESEEWEWENLWIEIKTLQQEKQKPLTQVKQNPSSHGQKGVQPSPGKQGMTPNLAADGVEGEAKKALIMRKHCSALRKAALCYHPCFQHKSKPQAHPSCHEEN